MPSPAYQHNGATVYHGDSHAILPDLPPSSADAIVTDPPAAVSFMGRAWDHDRGGRAQWTGWLASIFEAARRVLKPGGHALVWALPRTAHWTATALEDAGFEVRDCITHLFGQGFPKSHNLHGDRDGWGTALKPAAEFWWLARAPLSEPTVAANVARWGTGALNIGATRLAYHGAADWQAAHGGDSGSESRAPGYGMRARPQSANITPAGRWPPNVALSHTLWCQPVGTRRVRGSRIDKPAEPMDPAHRVAYGGALSGARGPRGHGGQDGYETVDAWDCAAECPVRLLDAQSGERKSGGTGAGGTGYRSGLRGNVLARTINNPRDSDTGGASRFFYVAKPSPAERNRGLPDGERNQHPTVKSIALCRWLVRLITPPGGTVLDPFMGSGSVGCAALAEGMQYVGIEQDPQSVQTATYRLAAPA